MKIFILYWFLSLVLYIGHGKGDVQNTQSLSDCHSLEDTLQYLKKEFVESGRFVGKPAKEVFQALKATLPIVSAHCIQTSPWIDPEGIAYLQGVTIHSDKSWKRKLDVGNPYIVIQVYFEDAQKDVWEFEQSIPREDYAKERMLDYMEDFIVKKVDIYILVNRFPTKEK